MAKIKSLADLRKVRDSVKMDIELRERGDRADSLVQVKVGMATGGIASGAKEIMNFFIEMLDKNGIEAVVTQTGELGHCGAEPVVEVILPDKDPILFSKVNQAKANEIIEQYIGKGAPVEGVLPAAM